MPTSPLRKKRRRWIILFLSLPVLAAALWLNNTSAFVHDANAACKLLAHRGMAQTFDVSTVQGDTNTARVIYPLTHEYLENTIASMRAAYLHGADVVEFDIQLTKDNKLAVFHDSDLSYRTDATGSISDYTMAELKKIDIGYGYTADGGETYPFRGRGTGLMPSIDEVLTAFPDGDLLIDIKSNDVNVAKALWPYLAAMRPEHFSKITVYGANEPIAYLREQSPTLRLMSAGSLKRALLAYAAIGWTGHVPTSIRNMELHLPLGYARWLWGWPDKFIERMARVNTRVVIVNGDGGFSEGFDDEDSLLAIPAGFAGYVWTNRVEVVAPLLHPNGN